MRTGRRSYKTSGMTTNGEFGPFLGVVMNDAVKGNLAWSRREQGAAGLETVYRLAITERGNSHLANFQRKSVKAKPALGVHAKLQSRLSL